MKIVFINVTNSLFFYAVATKQSRSDLKLNVVAHQEANKTVE